MSRMLDALKRLEGRRLLRPLTVPFEPAEKKSVNGEKSASLDFALIAPPTAPPISASTDELREACEATTLTIEPTPIVLGREVAITPPAPELPSILLQEVEELRHEVAEALRSAEPMTLSLIAAEKPRRKSRSRPLCHLPTAAGNLEPYRLLRDRILGPISSARSAMVMLTSPEEYDVARIWPLAVVCGERNRGEVLLVDATMDLSLARSFPSAASHVGIEDVLETRLTWDDVVRPTTAANVSLLTQGKSPARAETSEVSLWDDLRQQYSLVIIAADPAASPSTLWLAPLCDATYLILELGRSLRTKAAQARQSLETSGCNLLGCIALA